MLFSTGLIFSLITLSYGADFTYNLDSLNPSFVLYGQDLNDGLMFVINSENQTDLIQVNGLFEDFNNTNFILSTGNHVNYTVQDFGGPLGPRGLRVQGPVTLILTISTSTEFYLSFVIYPGDEKGPSSGYDSYRLALFESSSKIPPYYELEANATSAQMMTIINKRYSKDSCFEFDLEVAQIQDSCQLHIYTGAAPGGSTGALYKVYDISSRNLDTFISPTLSAAYYTFVVDAGCSASFHLSNHTDGTVNISPGDYGHGFLISCDYPGYKFNRKEPTKPFLRRFHATGMSTYPITVKTFQVVPGTGGFLNVQMFEGNRVTANVNITNTQALTYQINGTGNDVQITWSAGNTDSKGFKASFDFGQPTTKYFSTAKNSLVFDSRNWENNEKEIQARSTFIQVNVKLISTSPGTQLMFSDANQSISLSDLVKSPKSFRDFVHLNSNLEQTDFIATFTSYSNEADRIELGLDDYTIQPMTPFTTNIPLSLDRKNNSQAVTLVKYFSDPMFIRNIRVSDNCQVPLYVNGIPPLNMRNQMLLYTFTSKNSKTFVSSRILTGSATIIVPANCGFSADLSNQDDFQTSSIPFGGNGFVMSAEYPGNYDNQDLQNPPTSFDRTFYEATGLGDSKFLIRVPSADPGLNGNLSISIKDLVNGEAKYKAINIENPDFNRTLDANGYQLDVRWHPTQSKTGFLMTYEMREVSSSSLKNSLSISLIALVYFLQRD